MLTDLDRRLKDKMVSAVSDNAEAAELLRSHKDLFGRLCQSMIHDTMQFALSTQPTDTESREMAYHTAKAIELLQQTIEYMAAQHNCVSGL